jgi:hypothetical protein
LITQEIKGRTESCGHVLTGKKSVADDSRRASVKVKVERCRNTWQRIRARFVTAFEAQRNIENTGGMRHRRHMWDAEDTVGYAHSHQSEDLAGKAPRRMGGGGERTRSQCGGRHTRKEKSEATK